MDEVLGDTSNESTNMGRDVEPILSSTNMRHCKKLKTVAAYRYIRRSFDKFSKIHGTFFLVYI